MKTILAVILLLGCLTPPALAENEFLECKTWSNEAMPEILKSAHITGIRDGMVISSLACMSWDTLKKNRKRCRR